MYLNNKQLRQVKTMKFLGIIIDDKLTFREHITHVTEKRRKIIFALSKSAKLNWGLSHKAFKNTIHGRDTAASSIRFTRLGEYYRKDKPQEKVNKSAKANKHKNRESVQNSVK